MRSTRLIFLLFAIWSGVCAYAADQGTNSIRATIKHYDGTVLFEDGKPRRPSPLASDDFFLGENDVLTIVIEQTNPLLFTYEIKDGPPVPSESYAAALGFKTLLDSVVAFLPTSQTGLQRGELPSGAEAVLAAAGFDAAFVQSYAANVDAIDTALKSIPSLVSKSALTWDDAIDVRRTALGWTAVLDQTERQIATIKKADKALYDFARTQLASGVSGTNGSGGNANSGGTNSNNAAGNNSGAAGNNASAAGNSASAAANSNNAGANTTTGTANDAFRATGGGTNPIVDVNSQTTLTSISGVGAGPLELALNYMARHTDDVERAIPALRQFQKAASGIGQSVEKSGIRASVKEHRPQVVTIASKTDAPALPATAKPKPGTYTFTVKADAAVDYEFVEPAVVYSLVEREDWDTRATSDGKFEIFRNDDGDEINGTTVAGMLSITPRSWKDWSFAPSAQIGFSPVKDRFGIFGGFSFKIFDLFKIGGGIAYQQTEKLSSSQQPGQRLDSADDLDIEIEPDTGFYFGITVDLGKKR